MSARFVGAQASGWLSHVLSRFQRLVSEWSLESMILYPFGILAIVILERLFPAVPNQKTLSTGLVHDALWVLIEAAAGLLLVHWYGRLLYTMYVRHLSFLTRPCRGRFRWWWCAWQLAPSSWI